MWEKIPEVIVHHFLNKCFKTNAFGCTKNNTMIFFFIKKSYNKGMDHFVFPSDFKKVRL